MNVEIRWVCRHWLVLPSDGLAFVLGSTDGALDGVAEGILVALAFDPKVGTEVGTLEGALEGATLGAEGVGACVPQSRPRRTSTAQNA